MSSVLRLAKGEPVATMAVVSAFFGVLTLLGVEPKFTGAVGVLIGAVLAFPVRDGVNTVATTVTAVREATQEAASTVASQLGEATIGEVGVLTGTGAAVATNAAALASEAALVGLGVKRKDRANGP